MGHLQPGPLTSDHAAIRAVGDGDDFGVFTLRLIDNRFSAILTPIVDQDDFARDILNLERGL